MNLVSSIEKYVRADLFKHFIVSALICLILIIFLPSWAAGLITLGIGIIKEIYDKYKKNPTGFDIADLIADIIGILVIL